MTTYQADVQAWPWDDNADVEFWECGHEHQSEQAASRCGTTEMRKRFIPPISRALERDWRPFRAVLFTVKRNG